MLVTGVDQTSHSNVPHFALISFVSVFLHSVDNLLYDFNFSVPNIVDPKSLTLLGVSSSRVLTLLMMEILTSLSVHAG